MKVLITGASSGIGESLAYEFASKGYNLILVARDKSRLEKVKKNIDNVTVELEICDLINKESCKILFNKYRDVDILVNNAGFGLIGFFNKTDIENEIKMIETNVMAVHILTKLYLNEMIERDNGKILNVASIAGFLPGPLMATYYSTKNYVICLSESIREELRRKHSKVKISILCPGPVDTNFDKVANVDFSLKSLSSNYVARCAVKNLEKNKFYIIPGLINKILRIFSKFIPNFILSRFVYLSQRKKKNV